MQWILFVYIAIAGAQPSILQSQQEYCCLFNGYPGKLTLFPNKTGSIYQDNSQLSPSSPGNNAVLYSFSNTRYSNIYNGYYIFFQVSFFNLYAGSITDAYFGLFSMDAQKINGQITRTFSSGNAAPFHFDCTLLPEQLPPTWGTWTGWSTLEQNTIGFADISTTSSTSDTMSESAYPLPISLLITNSYTLSNIGVVDIYGGEFITFTRSDGSTYYAINTIGAHNETWFHGQYYDPNGYVWNLDGLSDSYTQPNYCNADGTCPRYCPGSSQNWTFAIMSNGWAGTLNLQTHNGVIASLILSDATNQLPNGVQGGTETMTNAQFYEFEYTCYLGWTRPNAGQTYWAMFGYGKSLHGSFWQSGITGNSWPFDGALTHWQWETGF